jgi:hypothetical protein
MNPLPEGGSFSCFNPLFLKEISALFSDRFREGVQQTGQLSVYKRFHSSPEEHSFISLNLLFSIKNIIAFFNCSWYRSKH